MAAISSSSEAFSLVRALCAADASRGTCSTKEALESSGSRTLCRVGGRVARFLYGSKLDDATGFIGTKMFNGALWLRKQALKRVCPSGVTNEVALTQFVLKEVRSGNCERLIRCLDAGFFSVVHDVLFFKGRFREGVFEQFTPKTVNELFSKSAKNGASQLLTLLLAQGPFLARVSEDDFGQAFIGTADNGHLECLLALLFHEGLVDRISDRLLRMGFMRASENGHPECLQALLSHDGFVDRIPDMVFQRGFMRASENGHPECLQALLSHDGLVDQIHVYFLSIGFKDAARNGHLKCLQALLSHDGLVDRIPAIDLGSVFIHAAGNGHLECLQALLSLDGLVDRISDIQLGFGFIDASANGHLECLQALLSHDGLIDRISDIPLGSVFIAASRNGHLECLQTLLVHDGLIDRVPDPSLKGGICSAAENGHLKCLQLLLNSEPVAARVTEFEFVDVVQPALAIESRETLIVAGNAHPIFSEGGFLYSDSILSLLHEFNLVFSTDMARDVLDLYVGDVPIGTPEHKNAFKECMTHVLLGYAREDGNSIRKQKAQQFLHSIWEQHGCPETDEGLDFAPNHMWDSLSVFAGALLDCQTG